ncbi:MAG: HAMP domain-containing histidine kinase [Proteobacteria bacterium]|nr:HAMP domain-containing histidine kinase [Pseudomonadota bacterium]MCP4920451.1 HAMP domain-containing histidine kinase [Pseudomonadota bacterium]
MTDARELANRIASRTAIAWAFGVLALAGLSIGVTVEGADVELDERLRAHALAGYGLAWFEDEVFHDEFLLMEPELLTSDVTIHASSRHGTEFGPAVPIDLTLDVLAQGDEVWHEVDGRRWLGIPSYDDDDEIVGVIAASAPTGPLHGEMLRFAGLTLAGSLALILGGVAISRRLSEQVLAALEASMQERERILAGAAHELRRPMATLSAVLEEPGPDALAQARTVVDSTSGMVQRLLTWSGLQHGALRTEPVRLDLLVEVCLEESDTLQAEACVVEGDTALLQVAIRNLVANARLHGQGLDRVVVRDGRVEVHDHGSGVDPALLAPFTKGDGSRGSGLGLALVQRIAERHGGRVELQPTMTLVLPQSSR